MLTGRILVRTFHDGENTGFYYENPANDLSDGDSFVRVKVNDDGGFLSDDGVNDDGRGHNVDDHDNLFGFYHLHVDEGNVDDDGQNDDDHRSHGSNCHACICSGSVGNHGHNFDDHDPRTSDDDETNSLGVGVEEVDIHHGNCRDRALY